MERIRDIPMREALNSIKTCAGILFITDEDTGERKLCRVNPVDDFEFGLYSEAIWDDPRTLAPFELVLSKCKEKKLNGITFVPDQKSNKLCGIIIADAYDPEKNEIREPAKKVVEELNTLTFRANTRDLMLLVKGEVVDGNWKNEQLKMKFMCESSFIDIPGNPIKDSPRTVAELNFHPTEIYAMYRDASEIENSLSLPIEAGIENKPPGTIEAEVTNTDQSQYTEDEALPFPILSPKALHGLLGDIVKAIMPYTEADMAAILISLLTAFSNIIGNSAFFGADGKEVRLNLFSVLVGNSSKARKGTSWAWVEKLLKLFVQKWLEQNVISGLATGEGLIERVRDDVYAEVKQKDAATGSYKYVHTLVRNGVKDKRIFIIEEEFSQLLNNAKKEGNIISQIVRKFWDCGKDGFVETVSKTSPVRSTGAHLSIVGHITLAELRSSLRNVDVFNGFANRFLWIAVRRSKYLPVSGKIPPQTLQGFAARLGILIGERKGEFVSETLMKEFSTLPDLLINSVEEELLKIKGVGSVRARQIKACYELLKRLEMKRTANIHTIKSPQDAADLVMHDMRYLSFSNCKDC